MEDPALLELVELANGDVALRKAESNEEPIVAISFSKESLQNMQHHKMDIARAMVEAAITTYEDNLEMAIISNNEPSIVH